MDESDARILRRSLRLGLTGRKFETSDLPEEAANKKKKKDYFGYDIIVLGKK